MTNDDRDRKLDAEELDDPLGVGPGIGRLVPCLWFFALDWLYSRCWGSLFASLPGLVLGGIPLVLLVLGRQTPVQERVDQYQAVAQAALARGDRAAAEVYFRRLAALRDGSLPTRYGSALAAFLQGDEARARSMMRSLAPEHTGGYADAHLWLAKDLFRQQPRLTPQTATVLEHHLRQALAGNRNDEEAASLLGVVLWFRGDAHGALPLLERTARQSPEWQLPLAVLYQARGDSAAAQQAAKQASAHFRTAAEFDPAAWQARVSWAQSEAVMKNFAEAERILQAGLAKENSEPLHQALAGVYLAWCALTSAQTPEGLATRLELLNRALLHAPQHPHVLTLLADLSSWDDAGADMAQTALHEALASGTAPATVHLVLGTRALRQGDWERAQTHLELACERAPDMPIVLNNLAWALAQRDPPELDRACELALAAKKLSDHPEISDTLGMILARQGKYRAAITELETALRAFPNRLSIHRQLAELYDQLDHAELAEAHRRRARAAGADAK